MVAKRESFQRARSPEKKAQRREALLAAAADLVDEGGVDAVSLAALAKRVGLSKSNIYTYFESREHILLELMHAEWAAWMEGIAPDLVALAGKNDGDAVAAVLAEHYLARPRLCALVAVVTSVLEQNVSEEAIAEFKTHTLALSARGAAMLHATLPALPFERCAWLLKPIFVAVAGFWPLANPPPAVAAVMARPEFAALCVDVETDLRETIAELIGGSLARALAAQGG